MFLLAVTRFIPRGWHRGRGADPTLRCCPGHERWRFPGPAAGPNAGHTGLQAAAARANLEPAWSPLLSTALPAAFRFTAPPAPNCGAVPQARKGRLLVPPAAAEGARSRGHRAGPAHSGRPQEWSGPAPAARAGQGLADPPVPARGSPRLPLKWSRPAHTRPGRSCAPSRPSRPVPAAQGRSPQHRPTTGPAPSVRRERWAPKPSSLPQSGGQGHRHVWGARAARWGRRPGAAGLSGGAAPTSFSLGCPN